MRYLLIILSLFSWLFPLFRNNVEKYNFNDKDFIFLKNSDVVIVGDIISKNEIESRINFKQKISTNYYTVKLYNPNSILPPLKKKYNEYFQIDSIVENGLLKLNKVQKDKLYKNYKIEQNIFSHLFIPYFQYNHLGYPEFFFIGKLISSSLFLVTLKSKFILDFYRSNDGRDWTLADWEETSFRFGWPGWFSIDIPIPEGEISGTFDFKKQIKENKQSLLIFTSMYFSFRIINIFFLNKLTQKHNSLFYDKIFNNSEHKKLIYSLYPNSNGVQLNINYKF